MDSKLQQAITDIKAGNKKTGRQLLVEVLKANPDSKDAETAWLWMSTLVSDPRKKRQCLEKVLKLNPANQTARKQIAKLDDKSEPLKTML